MLCDPKGLKNVEDLSQDTQQFTRLKWDLALPE